MILEYYDGEKKVTIELPYAYEPTIRLSKEEVEMATTGVSVLRLVVEHSDGRRATGFLSASVKNGRPKVVVRMKVSGGEKEAVATGGWLLPVEQG